MLPVLRIVGYGLGVVLLQWLVFGRLQLWGAYPDVVLLFVAFLRWYRTKSQLSTGEATVWFFVVFLVPVLGAVAYLYRSRTLRDPGT